MRISILLCKGALAFHQCGPGSISGFNAICGFSSGGCYTDITPRKRAISNGQRSLESFLFLLLSSAFLKILTVPNKAVFCSNPVLMVIPSLSSQPSAYCSECCPTATGTTSCCLIPHSFPISLFNQSIYSPSFSYPL